MQSFRNLSQLPNFAFSVPLAMFHLGKNDDRLAQKANAMVCIVLSINIYVFFNDEYYAGNLGHHTTTAARAALPFPTSVCGIVGCRNGGMADRVWVFDICCVYHMLMDVIGHGHRTNTIRESALKVDSGKKVPCGIREWNWLEDCTWLFDLVLYQLSWGARGKEVGKKKP